MNKQEYVALQYVAEAARAIAYNLKVWDMMPDGKKYFKSHMRLLEKRLNRLDDIQYKIMMLEQEVDE